MSEYHGFQCAIYPYLGGGVYSQDHRQDSKGGSLCSKREVD